MNSFNVFQKDNYNEVMIISNFPQFIVDYFGESIWNTYQCNGIKEKICLENVYQESIWSLWLLKKLQEGYLVLLLF